MNVTAKIVIVTEEKCCIFRHEFCLISWSQIKIEYFALSHILGVKVSWLHFISVFKI